ncbi:MAG: hypothetical protein WC777_05665 [Candidatus Gracilibacteria bacterium]|jgi:hypothetical protein
MEQLSSDRLDGAELEPDFNLEGFSPEYHGAIRQFLKQINKDQREDALTQLSTTDSTIRERGKSILLPIFYRYLEGAATWRRGRNVKRCFPFFDAEKAITELEAVQEQPRFQKEIEELVIYLLGNTREYPRFKVKSWEEAIAAAYESRDFKQLNELENSLNLSTLLEGVLSCDTDEEILRLLELHKSQAWLEDSLPDVLQQYPRIKAKYPGGLPKMIEDLNFISGGDMQVPVYRAFVEWASGDSAEFCALAKDPEAFARYLSFLKNLVNWMSDGAAQLVSSGQINVAFESDEGRDDKIGDQLDQFFEWANAIQERLKLSDEDRQEIYSMLSNQSVRYYGDPRWADYFSGLEYLVDLLEAGQAVETKLGPQRLIDVIMAYLSRRYAYIWVKSTDEAVQPSTFSLGDEDFHQKAAVLCHFFSKDNLLPYMEFERFVRGGLDRRVAAHLTQAELRQPFAVDINPHLEVPEPLLAFLEFIPSAQGLIKSVKEISQEGGDLSSDIKHRLKELLLKADTIIADESFKAEYRGVDQLVLDLKKALEMQVGTVLWSGVLGFAAVGRERLKPSAWLKGTNPATRMVVLGGALEKVLAARQKQGALGQQVALLCGPSSPEEIFDSFDRFERDIVVDLQLAIPEMETRVQAARVSVPGRMSLGTKVHTDSGMDFNRFHSHLSVFRLGQVGHTPFKLIHGGRTLVVPPLPTAYEQREMLRLFEAFGTLNKNDPDIQEAMGGRWAPHTTAVVGASILLSNHVGRVYAPGAFQSTADQTQARIMARDAGVRAVGLPYDLPAAVGRTDLLGQLDASSMGRYQLLGTLAAHRDFEGPLAPLMTFYERDFLSILREAGLEKALYGSPWVADKDTPDDIDAHESMVGTFVRAWQRERDLRQKVRALIAQTDRRLLELSPIIISSDPEEYERLLAA